MSDKAHNPHQVNDRETWTRIAAPLASFWVILLTILLVFAVEAPAWLEYLAARDANPARQAKQVIMRDVRLLAGSKTEIPKDMAAKASPLAQAVSQELKTSSKQ